MGILDSVSDFISAPFKGSGTSGSETTYEMSPEEQWLFEQIKPIIPQLIADIQAGKPGYTVPGMPSAPTLASASGVLSGVPPWAVSSYAVPSIAAPTIGQVAGYAAPSYQAAGPWTAPTYALPSAETMMPTADWWESISPEVMAGIRAAFDEGMRNLEERLGAAGQVGARGGYSGAAGAAMGEYAEEAAKDIGLQAWAMTQPALQRAYEAEVARGAQGAGWTQQALATAFGAGESAKALNAQLAQQALAQQYGFQTQRALSQAELQANANNLWAQLAAASGLQTSRLQTEAAKAPYEATIAERSMDLANTWQTQMADYQSALQKQQQDIQALQFPWTMLPGFMGATPTSTGITTQPQNWWQTYVAPIIGPAASAFAYGKAK